MQAVMGQPGGMKAGVQYMCCMVAVDEAGNLQAQLPAGAVPIAAGQMPSGQVPPGGVNMPMNQLPNGLSGNLSAAAIQQLTSGAVPIGHLPSMGTAMSSMGGGMTFGQSANGQFFQQGGGGMRPGGPGGGMNGMNGMNDQVWGGRQQAPAGPRPSRGRSPRGRGGYGGGGAPMGPQQAPGEWPRAGPGGGGQGGGPVPQQAQQQQAPERDWGNLRSHELPQRRGENSPSHGSRPNTFAALQEARRAARAEAPAAAAAPAGGGQAPGADGAAAPETSPSGKEPWKPSFLTGGRAASLTRPDRASSMPRQATERRRSAERRNSGERRTFASAATERRNSAEGRRQSQERRTSQGAERRHSQERRNSQGAERRHSVGRRAQSSGPGGVRPQVQQSAFWQQRLPSGTSVQVWLVADQNHLTQAVYRLNYLRPETVTAFDLHGVNLSSGGTLCLASVAFHDGVNQNVFMFDILQLGESFTALTDFLQHGQTSKLMYDVGTHAKICAQQFAITLACVFHAQSAFQMLSNRMPGSMIEVLEWCGVAPPHLKGTSVMMERAPALWTQRPLSKETLTFAVESLCSLLDSGHVLWRRLMTAFGQNAGQMVQATSMQRVQEAASKGWELRQAGNTGEPHDPELNDWLARRFGQTPEQARAIDADFLPADAVRAGDSPRTASWRATVAQMGGATTRSKSLTRQRSSSPSLDNWIERRNNVKDGTPKVHRASSLPPRGSTFISEKKEKQPLTSPLLAASGPPANFGPSVSWDAPGAAGKNWAEMLEEEKQASDVAEKESEENLFKELQQEEQRRLAQAELS
mmetsp:Transcript_30747/g.102427  ORF Transcript_30747/g.102427 Transcript_30747/m.102427 type:complete len:808 (+) Transcript_30747:120-2543(+)